jgi:hypothetical protein
MNQTRHLTHHNNNNLEEDDDQQAVGIPCWCCGHSSNEHYQAGCYHALTKITDSVGLPIKYCKCPEPNESASQGLPE